MRKYMGTEKVSAFLVEDLWRIRLEEQPRHTSIWVKILRVLVLSVREFSKNKCLLRASALTFYTLLSIVPILAMAFGIAKGFGLDRMLEERVREQFQAHQEVLSQVITFARNMLDNTKGGLVAGVGVILLFWSVIKVLGNIEQSFNEIWGIKKSRTLARKFSDYLSFMLIGPVMFIMASSMTIAVTSQVKKVVLDHAYLAFFSQPILISLRILPFAVLWGLFTFMYLFMPNGKVNVSSALLGGILAGTIYQVVQWAYIAFQIGINRYNAIYGSFAALPLFLMWLQLSWLIVLYGAEIAFAHQNVETYEFEQDCLRISAAFKRLVALAVAHLCVKKFQQGMPPPKALEISHELQTPIRLVNEILYDLVGAGILLEVKGDGEKEAAYQPAFDINKLTLQDTVDRLENRGVTTVPLAKSDAVQKLSACLAEFRDILTKSTLNILLKDL